MPGDRWQKFANLRVALRLDVGASRQAAAVHGRRVRRRSASGQHDRSLDWHLLDDPLHTRASQTLRARRSTRVEARRAGAVAARLRRPTASAGSTPTTPTQSVYSLPARSTATASTARSSCVANLTPVPRDGYRLGVPTRGPVGEVLNTDAAEFGGSGVGNAARSGPTSVAWHGHAAVARRHAAAARRRLARACLTRQPRDDERRRLVIHGHFYQPPRENPWTERSPPSRRRAPFHDWNERITAECYRPNACGARRRRARPRRRHRQQLRSTCRSTSGRRCCRGSSAHRPTCTSAIARGRRARRRRDGAGATTT